MMLAYTPRVQRR